MRLLPLTYALDLSVFFKELPHNIQYWVVLLYSEDDKVFHYCCTSLPPGSFSPTCLFSPCTAVRLSVCPSDKVSLLLSLYRSLSLFSLHTHTHTLSLSLSLSLSLRRSFTACLSLRLSPSPFPPLPPFLVLLFAEYFAVRDHVSCFPNHVCLCVGVSVCLCVCVGRRAGYRCDRRRQRTARTRALAEAGSTGSGRVLCGCRRCIRAFCLARLLFTWSNRFARFARVLCGEGAEGVGG